MLITTSTCYTASTELRALATMADHDVTAYDDEELFRENNDSVTDLHAYYMSQFNMELENGKTKSKNDMKNDSFRYGTEESFDFEVLDWNTGAESTKTTEFEIIESVIDSNINEQNMKEVLLDLDSIDFDDSSFKSDSESKSKETETNSYEINNEYIDDESLIDELCREDGESCRLTPDVFNEEYFNAVTNDNLLPSIETAFSKRYCNYNSNTEELIQEQVYSTTDNFTSSDTRVIGNLEHYSYPNNILYNLDQEKNYILPDTPTSCNEFNFDRNERKISVSDSIESDVQSASYYDENSENYDEDELFINLDDFGLTFEKDSEEGSANNSRYGQNERKGEKDKSQGERVCLWEHCFERHPNQNTLVEHIERAHVNTYKGDEFSCLWRECARARRPFNARYKLLIHMRVHSGHKPNRCLHPGCGKAFSRLENLKIHVRSHTGERPYACPAPHCRKAFSNSSDRAKHQRTHFNARPYACGAAGCGKRYTDPSSLRKHVKSHPHPAHPAHRAPAAAPAACGRAPARAPPAPPAPRAPGSPAKLATLRCIRDKLSVPRLPRL